MELTPKQKELLTNENLMEPIEKALETVISCLNRDFKDEHNIDVMTSKYRHFIEDFVPQAQSLGYPAEDKKQLVNIWGILIMFELVDHVIKQEKENLLSAIKVRHNNDEPFINNIKEQLGLE